LASRPAIAYSLLWHNDSGSNWRYCFRLITELNPMHQAPISTRLARLRAELNEIGTANSKYFEKKPHHHSFEERRAHVRRRVRVGEIRAELQTLMGRQSR
jgi:hypothetical protein